MAGLRDLAGVHRPLLERVRELRHRELPGERAAHREPVGGGDVDELHRAERLRELERHRVGVEAVGVALAVEAERGHHGDDAVREQRLQEPHVDPLDLAGEEVVDALQDAEGVRDHRVRGRGAQVGRGEALQDLVGQAVGGGEGELQGGGVGDARALEVRRLDSPLLGEGLDLVRRPVDEHGADAERPQNRHVHQDVDEVLVGDGGSVHRHHERLLPELGDVLEHAPEVGRSHAGNVILVAPPVEKSEP